MDPSSIVSYTHCTSLTSNVFDPSVLEKRLEQIQEGGELREHNSLLLTFASGVNIPEKLHHHLDFGAGWRQLIPAGSELPGGFRTSGTLSVFVGL
jgi:hypothetical protein